MKTFRRVVNALLVVTVGAALETAFVAISPGIATALDVTTAKVSGGEILIRGRKAVPLATITWEAQPVTAANGRGVFKFTTTILPEERPTDCLGMGKLSDGTETIDVLVQFCVGKGTSGTSRPTRSQQVSGVEVVSVRNILVPVGEQVSREVSCPEGKVALSGGHSVINLSGVRPVTSTNLVASRPTIDPGTGVPTGWLVTYSANQADNHSLTVYVVCAFVAP